jgi:hypothetical protein
VVPSRRAPFHPCADLFLVYAQRYDIVPQPNPQCPRQKGKFMEPLTKMYRIKRAQRSDGSIMGDVIPLGQVRALANLIPIFGEVAEKKLTKETVLDYGLEFRLNTYFDKELAYALLHL